MNIMTEVRNCKAFSQHLVDEYRGMTGYPPKFMGLGRLVAVGHAIGELTVLGPNC